MNHAADPHEFFTVRADSESLEIDLSPMEQALAAIPFQEGVFYTERPQQPADRDEDGITDEAEMGLQILGFSPFSSNLDEVTRFRERGLSIFRDSLGGLRISLEGFPVNEDSFESFYRYPLMLEHSQNLRDWETVEDMSVQLHGGVLEWAEGENTESNGFYRLRISP